MYNSEGNNDFSHLQQTFAVGEKEFVYFDIPSIEPGKYDGLPICMRVLLEAAVRHCDGIHVTVDDVMTIINWQEQQHEGVEVSFKPARVTLHDFTGVPAFVDFAAMRDAITRLGGDPSLIVSQCPVDIVIDHSVPAEPAKSNVVNVMGAVGQASSGAKSHCGVCINNPSLGTEAICPFHDLPTESASIIQRNEQLEFERNKERYSLLKWGAQTLGSVTVVPPGSCLPNQAVLEYLARIVCVESDGLVYPDTVFGTDSHTTLINGLGVIGWGIGGIEVEDIMLGHPYAVMLPQVVGCKIVGQISELVTSTDIVLALTKLLRQLSLNDKWIEFFGPGLRYISVADRQAIASMCPDYGAKCAFFPIDEKTLDSFKHMGHSENYVEFVRTYLENVKMFGPSVNTDPIYSQVVEFDLCSVQSYCSGPKRTQDKITWMQLKDDFSSALTNPVGIKGFGLAPENLNNTVTVKVDEELCQLKHGSVLLAAITSCTNATNPSVMLAAGLLAKNACNAGLSVKPHVKTSLMPGSGMVSHYLKDSGVIHYLEKLGFEVVGHGCMTCVSNSTPVEKAIVSAVEKGDIVAVSVLSGNRNTENRVQLWTQANYLASPLLVLAYALAGSMSVDLNKEPLGINSSGKAVYLRDIWPSSSDIEEAEGTLVIPGLFKEISSKITTNERWNKLLSPEGALYPWNSRSTFIRAPPFLDNLSKEPRPLEAIQDAYALLILGDGVITDHISPAGSIARNSPAARYLADIGLNPRDFNSYGSRRGNYAVMMRGSFGNARILNKLIGKPGPKTIHIPSGKMMDIYDAAERYKLEGRSIVVIAGKDYGSGSSRDWVAKGPWLLGVKAILAQSFDRGHRCNLIGMGILPLQFMHGENADSMKLTGRETFTIDIPSILIPNQVLNVQVSNGKSFKVICCVYTQLEVTYIQNGGMLNYFVRRALNSQIS